MPLNDAAIEYIQEQEYLAYEAEQCAEALCDYFQWKEDNKHLSDFHRYKFSYPPSD